MKLAALAVTLATVLVGLAWPAARGVDGEPEEPGLCGSMSATRLLEHPALAEQYADALRSQDAEELGRFARLLRDIRTAHGCEGEVSLPGAPRAAPRLPPGHPPVGHPFPGEGHPAPGARFEPPGIVTI
jgi:hypothetical protein